jgi:DNA-3-methyladenine glycosylase
MKQLGSTFFAKPSLEVAKSLLGAKLCFANKSGWITETEAYMGKQDPASHAASGKTARNAVMFDQAGTLYVYMIYGMHHCLNIVTEAKDQPAAVLIRGLYTEQGLHLDGPGKLCKQLGIDKRLNQTCCSNDQSAVRLYTWAKPLNLAMQQTPRIGIKKGKTLPWRFVLSPKGLDQLKKEIS